MARLHAILSGLLAALLQTAAASASPAPPLDELPRLLKSDYDKVRENPEDTEVFSAFLRKLPTFTVTQQNGLTRQYYVLEGDLLMTREEVQRAVVAGSRAGVDKSLLTPELIVQVVAGKPQYWPRDKRALTYAIDRNSFADAARYDAVVAAMADATGAWVAACPNCGLSLTHLAEQDAAPVEGKTTFIVRYQDQPSAYIALAFFPGAGPSQRYLYVFPKYFRTKYDRTGVFRHELGHVLGYRHEQIRKEAGCWQAENGDWQPLSAYDPKSVMHYFCEDQAALKLALSKVDVSSHAGLYSGAQSPRMPIEHGEAGLADPGLADITGTAPPPATGADVSPPVEPAQQSALFVSFVGGLVIDNLAAVLDRLADTPALLPTTQVRIGAGDTPEALLKGIGIPVSNVGLAQLVKRINGPKFDSRRLKVGDMITLPAVQIAIRQTARTFTPGDKAQQAEKAAILAGWGGKNALPSHVRGLDRVEFNAYDMTILYESDERLAKALERLTLPLPRSLRSTNVIIQAEPQAEQRAKAYAFPTAQDFERDCNAQDRLPSGATSGTTAPLIHGYDELLGTENDVAAMLSPFEQAPSTPTVYVVDTSILANPALAGGVPDLLPPPAPVKWLCKWTPFVKALHHGTFLASIVGSRNGQGFSGLASNAQLRSVLWQRANDQTPPKLVKADKRDEMFARKVNETAHAPILPIFLMASELRPYGPGMLNSEKKLKESEQQRRFDYSLAHGAITNQRPLLIAAAGQVDPSDASAADTNGEPPITEPVELTISSRHAPQGLGDQENVVIVTACTDCRQGSATLLPSAFFGKQPDPVVHLAAPGGNAIPAWIGPNGVGAAAGTSPAAAYVAGVAAAMIARFPAVYEQAEQVKRRLQLTAWPMLPGDAAPDNAWKKVAAGTVDYRRAQLDPTVSWLKNGNVWSPVRIKGWSDDLRFVNDSGGKKAIESQYLLRLLALAPRDGDPRFAVYTDAEEITVVRGLVRRWGPLTLSNPTMTIELCSGAKLPLGSVQELIPASFPPAPESTCPPLPQGNQP